MSDNNSKLPNNMQPLLLPPSSLSASRAEMFGSMYDHNRIEDSEYMNRKVAMTGKSRLNPYVDMSHTSLTSTMRNATNAPSDVLGMFSVSRAWCNVPRILTYCGISDIEFTMSNESQTKDFELTIKNVSMLIGGNVESVPSLLAAQIRSTVFDVVTGGGKRTLTATIKANMLHNVEIEYSLDNADAERLTLPALSNNLIKHLGESEIRQANSNFDGDMLSHLQLGQSLFPRGVIGEIDSSIFVDRTKSSMVANDLFILDEVTSAHKTIQRGELTDIKIKHKWFKGLPAVEQQMYKIAMLSNNAHTYRAVDCDVPEQWQKLSFNQTFGLVPRYGNSVIQPCNLVFKTDSTLLGIYSIFSSKTTREGVCNAMYLRDWSEGLSSKRYYRCEDGDKFAVVDLADDSVRRLEPETPEYVLIEARFRVYGNIFAYRLEQYENKVKDSIPVSVTHGKEQILEEALAWYLDDITVPDTLIQDEKYLVTCTEALPTLRRYRGELSKPTGRKMPAHDRSAHTNRRYNPDGSIKMEWEVPVVEVNGGAKERFGIQISNIIPHLTEK